MPETTLSLTHPCQKDPTPVPLPRTRALGLTELLRSLAVGESGVVPRHSTGDLYRTGLGLGKRFTCRRLDAETSRVWRVA
jgi:hypothetical protein